MNIYICDNICIYIHIWDMCEYHLGLKMWNTSGFEATTLSSELQITSSGVLKTRYCRSETDRRVVNSQNYGKSPYLNKNIGK